MIGLGILLFAAFLVVITVGSLHAQRVEAERCAKLTLFAQQHGMIFSSAREPHLPGALGSMADFARGHSRYAYNLLTGVVRVADRSPQLLTGDYHYAVTRRSNNRSRTTHYRFSFLAVRCAKPATPRVTLRREMFIDKISSALGFNDIDFESAEFSRRFHVSSDDKRFAYDLLHPRAIEALLETSPERLELCGEWLCLTNGTQRWEPDEFLLWRNWMSEFIGLWPAHLEASLAPTEETF
ncbi:hypothetical protein [Botrimarina hoheduenensis]|uniref:Uncharacterized protein n=1 Tax=Botrimarina hoheduenensis TaxID=2528000 RepID=A0A5C5WAJ5_9BACT|nr:hypothetical protein [Botrimarina hoheduenensis]TWT46622.1 hypothetical protein Pla111_17230 [Botrimarina hoheduenensis]